MKFFLLLVLACGAIFADKLNVKQCSGQPSLIAVPNVSTVHGTGTVVDKNSKLTIRYISSTSFDASETVDIKLQISKWMLVGYVPVPEFIYSTVAKQMNDPNVQYLGDKTFRVGCPVLGKYMPCPPPSGQHDFSVVLKPVFEQAASLAGVAGSFFGSGFVKIHADAHRSYNKDKLVCLDIEVNIKL